MPNVYFLGGFLGSELFNTEGNRQLLWISFSRLLLGQIGQTRLASDGISPGPPDGRELSPGGPIPLLYKGTLAIWDIQLQKAGLTSIEAGYDWRLPVLSNGSLFAQRIRNQEKSSDPCAIVAHSNGGLVARAAWYDLVRNGGTDLVRRIVTLGTPHRGSFTPVTVLSLANQALDQLNFLTTGSQIVISAVSLAPITKSWSILELCQLIATWPGLYDLFPLVDAQSAITDPMRPLLFELTSWPEGRGISGDNLIRARDVTGAFLRSPDSLPPPNVLTTVAGTGTFTFSHVTDGNSIGSTDAINGIFEGDDTVTVESALVRTGPAYILQARHNDLPGTAVTSGQLLNWITAVGAPSPPPPPPAVIPGVQIPRLTDLPMVRIFGPRVDCFR